MKAETMIAAEGVQQLVPEGSGTIVLLPETRVLCIHRGRRQTVNGRPVPLNPRHDPLDPKTACHGDYVDTYDSKHYLVKPGHFEVEYGAAKHFRDRAVVPGSRNPETTFQASFIAIIGVVVATAGGMKVVKEVDPPEDWEPFTDEECQQYEVAFEALDRASMVNAVETDVELRDTMRTVSGGKASRVKGGSNVSPRPGRRTSIQTSDPSVLQPIDPAEHEGIRDINENRAAADAEGHTVR